MGVYAGRPDLATHPHNLFLGLAVFFGIPAAVAFAGVVLLAVRAAWRSYRTREDERQLTALGLVAALVALLANGLLEYPFWNPTLSTLIVLLVALPFGVARNNSKRSAAPTVGSSKAMS